MAWAEPPKERRAPALLRGAGQGDDDDDLGSWCAVSLSSATALDGGAAAAAATPGNQADKDGLSSWCKMSSGSDKPHSSTGMGRRRLRGKQTPADCGAPPSRKTRRSTRTANTDTVRGVLPTIPEQDGLDEDIGDGDYSTSPTVPIDTDLQGPPQEPPATAQAGAGVRAKLTDSQRRALHARGCAQRRARSIEPPAMPYSLREPTTTWTCPVPGCQQVLDGRRDEVSNQWTATRKGKVPTTDEHTLTRLRLQARINKHIKTCHSGVKREVFSRRREQATVIKPATEQEIREKLQLPEGVPTPSELMVKKCPLCDAWYPNFLNRKQREVSVREHLTAAHAKEAEARRERTRATHRAQKQEDERAAAAGEAPRWIAGSNKRERGLKKYHDVLKHDSALMERHRQYSLARKKRLREEAAAAQEAGAPAAAGSQPPSS